MSNVIYSIKRAVLTAFGKIKIFKWPFFVIYQPTSFRIKGENTRDIMNNIRTGDVIMRAYVDYLDGYFIPKGESGCSHSGVYVGDNLVIHSIAEGLSQIDIIDFCRADKIIVLRPNSGQDWAIIHANRCVDEKDEYNFDFKPEPGKYYCHEFTASCYPNLNIEILSRKALGFISSPKAFLADSFYTNSNFTKIYPPAG